MAIDIELTPAAVEDARAAYAWYEAQSAGLGVRFVGCLEESLEIVRRNPQLFEVVYKQYRRTLIRKFPYVVFYKVEGESVKVHSVFHSAQDPKKWRRRLP